MTERQFHSTQMPEAHSSDEEIFSDRIELRGMPQSFRTGKCHAPRKRGDGSVELLIDEVPKAPKRQTDRDRDHGDVGKCEQGNLVLARHIQKRQGHAEETAMACHASLPHGKDLQRMTEEITGIVEKHVAEPSANK